MLPYSIKEGLAGFRRARLAAAAATTAMAVALVLIGLFGLVSYEAQQVAGWLRQRVGELEIFLEDTEADVASALYDRARYTLGVAEAEYISKEEAEQVFLEEFGEGGAAFIDEPFLPASIKVRVEPDYANPDSLEALAAEFASWNRVDDVVFNQELLVKVQQNLRLLAWIGLSLGSLVVLASLFLVANTIRLTIYARRLLIRTMKLVGATDSFIRRPFLVEGVVQGLIAGAVASLLLWALYTLLAAYLPQLGGIGPGTGLVLGLGLLLFGALLGWTGSLIAVRRFLHGVRLHG